MLLYSSCKVFILILFLASKYPPANRYLVGFTLLPLKCPINFSLNLLGTGLLYLLDIMMNSSVVSVQHLVCYLDLKVKLIKSNHAFSALALKQISANFEGRLYFEILSFDLSSVLETLSECSFFIYFI